MLALLFTPSLPRLADGISGRPEKREIGVFGIESVTSGFLNRRIVRFFFFLDSGISLSPSSSAVSSASASWSLAPSSSRVRGIRARVVVGEFDTDCVLSPIGFGVCRAPVTARDFSFDMKEAPLDLLVPSPSSHEVFRVCPCPGGASIIISVRANCTLRRPGGDSSGVSSPFSAVAVPGSWSRGAGMGRECALVPFPASGDGS